jgi:hypothetical protein
MEGYYADDGTWFPGVSPDAFDWYNSGFLTLPYIPEVQSQNQTLGINPHIQTFFEGPKKCDCCPNWIEKAPTELPEVAKERYDQASVRVYKKKDHESGSSTLGGLVSLKDETVEIQSRIIIDLIRPILADVGRLVPEKNKIKFESPFRDLYFAHSKIVQLLHKYRTESNERQHLEVLVKVMDGLFSKMSSEVKGFLERKTISFKYVWTLFPKNIIVYHRDGNTDRLYQVVNLEYQPPPIDKMKIPAYWQVNCRYFIFDGKNFGTCEETWRISEFDNVRSISSLTTYPVGYHSDAKLEQKLAERAKRILDFQDMSYCEYDGVADAAYYIDEDDDSMPHNYRNHVRPYVVHFVWLHY